MLKAESKKPKAKSSKPQNTSLRNEAFSKLYRDEMLV